MSDTTLTNPIRKFSGIYNVCGYGESLYGESLSEDPLLMDWVDYDTAEYWVNVYSQRYGNGWFYIVTLH